MAWTRGDRAAGRELVAVRLMPQVHRFFHNKLGPEQAEELVQETFVDLPRSLETFRYEASVRTLVFRIARNKLNGYLRGLMQDRSRSSDPGELSLAAIGSSPSERMARRAQERFLLSALRQLPLNTQIMIELHYWEEMRVREIACILELPEGTVKSAISRGRKRLEVLLENMEGGDGDLAGTQSRLSVWALRVRDEIESG